MARRNSTFSTIIVLCILGLAAYGSYVIWGKKDVQKTMIVENVLFLLAIVFLLGC